MMDDQLFELLKDRFDRQDTMLREIEHKIEEHAKTDERYWRKIDVQDGQISLLKWAFGGAITTALGALWAWFSASIKG